jgi:transcriptional regulator with XRE-family HTH domain
VVSLGAVLRDRRTELGLSQADVAAAAGVDKRQIRRYEADQQQPVLSVAVALAAALRLDVAELAGAVSRRIDLSGRWWAAWQTFRDGTEILTSQEVRVDQRAQHLDLVALDRGSVTLDEGGYLWRGELRLWDNEILMGWYAAEDGAVRSKGTLYLVVHPHGQHMTGRWVGLSHDGATVTGWAAFAHGEDPARNLIAELASGSEARS